MALLRQLLLAGLIAGLAGGAVLTLLQRAWVTPLIRQGEAYEAAPGGGEQSRPARPGGDAPSHETPTPHRLPFGAAPGGVMVSLAANGLLGIGFALVLAGGMALSRLPVNGRRGLVWGAAGFLVFTLAPALGVPPALPGGPAVPVAQGQAWWLGTAAATAFGLALLAFGGRPLWWAAGAIALALPHLVGAPLPGPAPVEAPPPELARAFVVAALATAAVFWLVLGGVAGLMMRRPG